MGKFANRLTFIIGSDGKIEKVSCSILEAVLSALDAEVKPLDESNHWISVSTGLVH